MKLALFLVLAVVAQAVAELDLKFGLMGVEVADLMSFQEAQVDQKPTHGICFKEPIVCDAVGALVAYTGANNCISCVCGSDFGVICCREKPYPIVEDPEKCSLYLDPVSCNYKRHPRCKHYCDITGWYYTDLEGMISEALA